LSSHKVDINIENKISGLNYTGNGKLLDNLNLKLKNLELGIKECFDYQIKNIS
jgi:hypothetical protein